MKVIIAEHHSWDTVIRIGNHHYCRAFMKNGWDALWLSHPVSFLHGMKSENKARVNRARSGPHRHPDGPVEIIPNTYLPFYNAPFFSSRWVLENNHRCMNPSIGNLLGKSGFTETDLLWITDTDCHFITDYANAKVTAVRIADDNTQFVGMPKSLHWAEEKLCSIANVVFVTSAPLEDKLKPKYGEKVSLLRNGVDCSHFQGEFERPEEFRDIEGPIAVYVGAIDSWFEPAWIQQLARAREDITVILIGRCETDLSVPAGLSNVRVLGARPYSSIPAYLAHSDCGIIPFKRTPLVESVSPLKLFEFFASGLPVVSTRWQELDRLGSPAVLVDDAEEFVGSVGMVIDQGWKKDRGEEFREYAKGNSWESRFGDAMKVLDELLA